MQLPPERPIALAVSFAVIRTASQIVPSSERTSFQGEWQYKLFHRWQFLIHTGLWSLREALLLLLASFQALPDAVQHFGAQESVRNRVSRFVQSPLTCLGVLAVLLIAIAFISGGFPATSDLLFKRIDRGPSRLVYIWAHNLRGGGDKPLPAEVVKAWKTHSQLISDAAAFRAVHRDVQVTGARSERLLVVTTEPSFFRVMSSQPIAGSIDNDVSAVILSYDAWVQLFHGSPRVIGTKLSVAGKAYPVRGIMPAAFAPLSKQTAVYLVDPRYFEEDAYAAVKAKAGVTSRALDREFARIAQDVTFYFLQGQIHYGFAQADLWTPVRSFVVAALASGLMLLMVFRVKWSALWPNPKDRRAYFRRATFFAVKTFLALVCVFTACLEWSRSTSAILFGNFDPASGPFLLWLYILGTMGVFFWASFDQKARCRECLELLAFPVRMGSPGNLLLDWSGIELCCTQGHGVLHVPHLAPSWAEESDHWISLDDSWQGIFGREK